MKAVLAILLLAILAGCTTTRWKHIDELGAVTQGQQNTFFAKTDASAIQAAYKGEGDKWDLEIGSTADNADSTDVLVNLQQLADLLKVIVPLLIPATAPVLPGG